MIFCVDRVRGETSDLKSGEDSRGKRRAIRRVAVAGVGPRGDLARPLHEEQVWRCTHY